MTDQVIEIIKFCVQNNTILGIFMLGVCMCVHTRVCVCSLVKIFSTVMCKSHLFCKGLLYFEMWL